MTHNVLAYFTSMEEAKKAADLIGARGFPSLVDRVNKDVPDPDLSVSELMIGFLPDLAHGIFGSGREKKDESGEGAFLLVILEEPGRKNELIQLLRQHGADLVGNQ
jgi:hypothetical protein